MFPTNALRDAKYVTHIKTLTCFGTQVPSSGSYKGVEAHPIIYFVFIVVSFFETFVVKIHIMFKIHKIDIFNNLQCFDNTRTLFISRLVAVNCWYQYFDVIR